MKDLQEVVGNGETVEVSNLKSVDRRKVLVELKLVESLIHRRQIRRRQIRNRRGREESRVIL